MGASRTTSASGGPTDRWYDRRRGARRVIPGIEATLRSPGDVRVLDVSLTGLATEVPGELAPGQHCFISLRHDRHTVMVETVVKWAGVNRMERRFGRLIPMYRAGMVFVDIEREDSGGIWDWILTEAEEQALPRT